MAKNWTQETFTLNTVSLLVQNSSDVAKAFI